MAIGTEATLVWYKADKNSEWRRGSLVSTGSHNAVVVRDERGKLIDVKQDNWERAHSGTEEDLSVANLTLLPYLSEPQLLDHICRRFLINNVYTMAGPVLVAVNPCKQLPLYSPDKAIQYRESARHASHGLLPHIFLVGANAYRTMDHERQPQSLVITGESGAGKTESTKKVLQFLATLAGADNIEQKILQSTPILEAFGNAQTLRNHNSSRFGKLIRIHFNHSLHICGASIETYLLEKSRVVQHLAGERSYHVFYQMLRGANAEQSARWGLTDDRDTRRFKYLAQGGAGVIRGVDDAKSFHELCLALDQVGFSSGDQEALFDLAMAVLWLGQVEFTEDEQERASLTAESLPALTMASRLLHVSDLELSEALTTKTLGGKVGLRKQLRAAEAQTTRNSLAMAVYAGIFDWLVREINKRLDPGRRGAENLHISLLDIFGFEHFENHNSFEQFCINYANECLQQLFVHHMIKEQEQEYRREGIPINDIVFEDNEERLNLLGRGDRHIMSLLDDQCKQGRDHKAFLQVLNNVHCNGKGWKGEAQAKPSNRYLLLEPLHPDEFTVRHYATDVRYQAEGFITKNKISVSQDLVKLMTQPNGHKILMEVGKSYVEAPVNKTVGQAFFGQIQKLEEHLKSGGLHFVRCIKPNNKLVAGEVDRVSMCDQLRCSGVMEVAKIAKQGYPVRYPLQRFVERYSVLVRGLDWQPARPGTDKEQALELLRRFFPEADKEALPPFHVGATGDRIYFRAEALGRLEDSWSDKMRAARMVQSFVRQLRFRNWYESTRTAAVVVQSSWRQKIARMLYEGMKKKKQEEVAWAKRKMEEEEERQRQERISEERTKEEEEGKKRERLESERRKEEEERQRQERIRQEKKKKEEEWKRRERLEDERRKEEEERQRLRQELHEQDRKKQEQMEQDKRRKEEEQERRRQEQAQKKREEGKNKHGEIRPPDEERDPPPEDPQRSGRAASSERPLPKIRIGPSEPEDIHESPQANRDPVARINSSSQSGNVFVRGFRKVKDKLHYLTRPVSP